MCDLYGLFPSNYVLHGILTKSADMLTQQSFHLKEQFPILGNPLLPVKKSAITIKNFFLKNHKSKFLFSWTDKRLCF